MKARVRTLLNTLFLIELTDVDGHSPTEVLALALLDPDGVMVGRATWEEKDCWDKYHWIVGSSDFVVRVATIASGRVVKE